MKDAMIRLGWALVFLVPGGLILWIDPLLWALASFFLAVGGAIFALVMFGIFAPRIRTSQSSAHAATIEAMHPLAPAAWLGGGLVLAALVTWAAWGVVWTPLGGAEPIGLSIAALLCLAGAWMTVRGAIGMVDWLAFGRVRLEFDSWPLCTGALIQGHAVVARGAHRLAGIDVRMALTYNAGLGREGNWGDPRPQEIWGTVPLAAPGIAEVPGAFGFAIRIPASYTGMQIIHLSASDGSRANIARSFEVMVWDAAA